MNTSNKRTRITGQGMTEYIIIVAVIAIAAIGVFSLFGKTARDQVAGLASELAGKSGETDRGNALTAADDAGTKADADKGLGNYFDDNFQAE
jgi:hypothetical protein